MSNLRRIITIDDFKSGFIVSLVALPLCLAIALASGAPLLSGVIAGIVGGILVGSLSNSHVSVSGPAAGLTVIVLGAITELGSFNLFLATVVLAGVFQLSMGVFKLGVLSKYIYHSVIEGMLAAIGVLIIIKQIPYAFGVLNPNYLEFFKSDLASQINMGAFLIGLLCVGTMIVYNTTSLKTLKIFQYIPLTMMLVVLTSFLAFFFHSVTSLSLEEELFVNLGGITKGSDVFSALSFPDFSQILNFTILKYTLIIALVASIETLLCIKAGDQIDPYKRQTSSNRELVAQGIGNMASGFLGGLPITSVIVRTSVNIQSGAKTKYSAVIHGFVILMGLLVFPTLITKIPLAVLACILLLAGYNLAHPTKIMKALKEGYFFAIPFFTTIFVIVFADLLVGVIVGQIVAVILNKLVKTSLQQVAKDVVS